jgi:preprotein translocase subunit YajC
VPPPALAPSASTPSATIKDDTVILNVGDKTRLEFMKSHISQMRETKKAEAK